MTWWHRANGAVEDFFMNSGPLTILLTVFGAVVAVLVLMGGCFAAIDAASPPPNHGSCKVGHYEWTGKANSFICDEWYPLPQVQGRNQ